MERKNENEYLLSDELKKKLRINHYDYRIREPFDDFYHDYVIHILEGKGKHQSIDQYTIDYIRNKLGRNGQRLKLYNAIEFDGKIHEKKLTNDQISPAYLSLIRKLLSKYEGRNRIFIKLYYIYGFQLKEIADLFCVTESRISQILKNITEGVDPDSIPDIKKISPQEYEEVVKENIRLKKKLHKHFTCICRMQKECSCQTTKVESQEL